MGFDADKFKALLGDPNLDNKIKQAEENEPVSSVQLTPCQEVALSEIVAWSYTPGGSVWTLSGAAGTGKTFVTQEILKHIRQTAICVSAPTHKAKKIISKVTGYYAETLQSLLGLMPDTDIEDFNINKVKFDQKNKPKIRHYSFIVIDEASMIGTELFNLLMTEAKSSGTKILFIGDHIQLPPVKEALSPVFIANNVKGISTLKTPARQKPSNPLSMLLIALRIDIDPTCFNDVYKYLETAILTFGGTPEHVKAAFAKTTQRGVFRYLITHFPNLWNPVTEEGYFRHTLPSAFAEHVTSIFETFSTDNPDYCKILAYTNKRVSEYNRVIRRQVLKNPEEDIVVGDIVMAYTSITNYPEKEAILTNSEEYVVTAVEKADSEYGVAIYEVHMETADKIQTMVNVVRPEDYRSFTATHSVALERGKNHKDWRGYYNFKNKHLVLQSLNQVYKTENLPKKDLDYSFGITVHKSQGSTYEVVMVDGDNIREGFTITQQIQSQEGTWNAAARDAAIVYTLKLMYVALSRAKTQAIMIIS